MIKNRMKIVGITNLMELHLHGKTEDQEFYTNISIPKILDILAEYADDEEDKEEAEMLNHLSTYFYDKIII